MTSAELARVNETTEFRIFDVENDNGIVSKVSHQKGTDNLYCHNHGTMDDCTCTARVRLSGILTNTVTKDVRRAG